MAGPYTTPDMVQAILAEQTITVDLTPFIVATDNIVSVVCAPGNYSTAQLTQIETWLAAHFYCIMVPRNLDGTAAHARDIIESKVDLRFNVTRYGQMAMALDPGGYLAAFSNSLGIVTTKLAAANRKPMVYYAGRRTTSRFAEQRSWNYWLGDCFALCEGF